MTITNTSTHTAPVNRVLSTLFIKDARPLCHYFIGSRPGDVMESHKGTFTMLFRQYDNVSPTVSALTEDTGALVFPVRSGTSVSITDVSATVKKYGAHAFLTEELVLRDVTQAGLEIVEIFAVQGGRSLNRLQRNILEDNAVAVYASGGSANSDVQDPISHGLFASVINTLDRNTAIPFMPESNGSTIIGSSPIVSGFFAIGHTDVGHDFSQLSGFIGVEKYASHTRTFSHEIGMIHAGGLAVRFISSSEATIDTGSGATTSAVRNTTGSADIYTTVIFGKNAHGALSLDAKLIRESYRSGERIPGLMLIAKAKGSAGTADPMDEISSTGWKAWHGGVILSPAYIRGIHSAATIIAE